MILTRERGEGLNQCLTEFMTGPSVIADKKKTLTCNILVVAFTVLIEMEKQWIALLVATEPTHSNVDVSAH